MFRAMVVQPRYETQKSVDSTSKQEKQPGPVPGPARTRADALFWTLLSYKAEVASRILDTESNILTHLETLQQGL